jgi:hypothetical protein
MAEDRDMKIESNLGRIRERKTSVCLEEKGNKKQEV